ncbi:MAG: AAA family ATPase [bacterium]|nr:AAA family ATPase [bacterium]
MGQYDINLRDYWRIIRKRKTIIIFTTILLAIFSFIFAKLNEPAPIYSSSSAIRIDRNTAVASVIGDSSGLGGQFQEMSTQTAVIRSYPVMERVAKELGLIDKSLSSEEIAKNSRLVSVVNSLSDQTESEQIGDTNLIRIKVTSTDPDQAARMANTIAAIFRLFNYETRNEATLKQSQFINGQLEASERALKEAEQNIKKYKEEKSVLSVSIEATVTSRALEVESARVGELEKLLEKLRDAIQQVRFIGEFQEGKTKRVPVDDIESGLGPLNKQLVELQVQRDTLLDNFTVEHPSVRTIIVQIKNVVREMLLTLEGRERSLAGELEYRKRELKKITDRNNEIPNIALELQRLERKLATNMEVHNLLRQKAEEVKIKLAGTQHLVHIVKPAFRPAFRDNPPQVGVNTFVGALLGLIVGAVFALVLETMDTSIGAIEDVESYLEIPVLGVIPVVDAEELEQEYLEANPDKVGRFTSDMFGRLVTHFVPRSPIAEAYRSFRTQMDFLALEKGGNLFLLTSTTPGEGKTTTSINFAIAYAQTNKRTLLIDADMRKPTIYRVFGIDREPGLTEVLLGNYTAEECIRTMTDIMLGKFDMEDIMITPGLDNLSIMTCGSIPPNPSELLGSPRMNDFLEEVRGEYDVVIIDTPPPSFR